VATRRGIQLRQSEFQRRLQRSKWQPRVLERRGQPSLVAVGFGGGQQPARLVVLDPTGKLVVERSVSSWAWPESANADLQLLEVTLAGDAVPPLASWLDRYPSSIPTSRCRLPPWMWERADIHRLHHGRGLNEGGDWSPFVCCSSWSSRPAAYSLSAARPIRIPHG
jgi:hypothetical protein